MKLLCNKSEIQNLINLRLLEPISDTSYVLNLRNSKGVSEVKVEVITEISKISAPSLLSLSGNGAFNIPEWIDDWRKGWYGKRPKGMGSKQKCITNMADFFKRNPRALVEDIYTARDMYLRSVFERNGDYTFLQQADYFIKKQKIDGTTERNLESFYEEAMINKELGGTVDYNKSINSFDNV